MNLRLVFEALSAAGVEVTPEQEERVRQVVTEEARESEMDALAVAREEWLAHGDRDDEYVSGANEYVVNDAGEPMGWM